MRPRYHANPYDFVRVLAACAARCSRVIDRGSQPMTMTESEFSELAEATLDAIEAALEATGADIEASRSGNVLTLELDNGSKVVVNSQAPMQQIWVAARSGGFHYGRQDGAWIDTREGSELFAALSRILSAQGGTPVLLAPPR
jgi:CyaY protein